MSNKVGKRQRRINRQLAPLSYSSNPADWESAAQPVFIAELKGQLKRGYKAKRNGECPCGSGNKYKNCHRQLENATPRWNWDDNETVVFDPEQNKWISYNDLKKKP